MRLLKTRGSKYQAYIDLDKVFRYVIVPMNNNSNFKVRAHFLVGIDLFPNNQQRRESMFQDIDIFDSKKEAEDFIEALHPDEIEIIEEVKWMK